MSTLSAHSVCPCAPRARPVSRAARLQVRAAVSTSKIVVKSNVSKEQLEEMGVPRWPTWGCGASKFPWSYAENETCYVLQGRVLVTPDGGEAVEIKAGDMATFPAGMSCTWDVKEAINKHYNFH
uniref:(S)-ureidoglycine aminohydrolase cupin domain-containing protein n=1 Tax=Tetradesmus obliquus TaxID=3088 RepID=A0A383W9H6_TETOB|eukprot:jgi/Sobl393_1/8872/SZX73346.1